MPRIQLPANGWQPRGYQMKSWKAWEDGCKRSLLVWHRRAGKDEIELHKHAVAAHERIGTYWHMLPEYAQARKAIWEAVNPHTGKRRIDEAFPHELRATTRDDQMFIRFKSGSTWQLVGSDNFSNLVGTPPIGLTFSEWARANPSAWGYLSPILLENGGWASFISTPLGRNHMKTMLDMAVKSPDWFTEVLTVKDTGAISLELVETQRKEYHSIYGIDHGDALIEQEYFCSFEAAILGAYYGRELVLAKEQNRIGLYPVDPDAPVHTAWDLGVGDLNPIWFWQAVGPDIRVVDYYSSSGYAISHYADVIKNKAAAGGYERGTDYVPHDAKQRSITSTGADGKAKQRLEVMIECGLKPVRIPASSVDDGISAVRQILHRCHFNEATTEDGLEALRQYRAEWDDEKKIFKTTPLHNWASHGADGFRTLAMAYKELAPETVKPAKPKELIYEVNEFGRVTANMSVMDIIEMKRKKRNRE